MFGYCLPYKMAQGPCSVCRDDPNTNEQAICRQFSEISFQERSEKQLAVVLYY